VTYGPNTPSYNCFAYKWDDSPTYDYIFGIDSSSVIYGNTFTPINSNVGALACAYSRNLDFFATGGTKPKNFAIINSNQIVDTVYSFTVNVQAMDFSDDGVYLGVGFSDGSINIYTQSCNIKCDSAFYFDLNNNECT
jgi:hypothetical protein